MKNSLLSLLCVFCASFGVAQAQTPGLRPLIIQTAPTLKFISPDFSLEPVKDKPGVFRLTAKQANPMQVMDALVLTSGVDMHSTFSVSVTAYPLFGSRSSLFKTPFTLSTPLEGTPEQLIDKVASVTHFRFKPETKNVGIRTHFAVDPVANVEPPKQSM